jgi:hypothetical protein
MKLMERFKRYYASMFTLEACKIAIEKDYSGNPDENPYKLYYRNIGRDCVLFATLYVVCVLLSQKALSAVMFAIVIMHALGALNCFLLQMRKEK